MAVTTLTFEAPSEVVSELDRAASIQKRDRNAILQDAVIQYLASDSEFRALIQEGIRQSDAGELVEHAEVKSMIANWENKAKKG